MFRIGEFSKISRVSKRLLHYYDDIGLLRPAHVDHETGYRYYSAQQLTELNRILALKDLGLTLDQITTMMGSSISDEDIQGMLMMKKAEAEQAVFEDLRRLRRIEARLQQNQSADKAPDVVIKSIPAQPFLSTRHVFKAPEELMQLVEQIMHRVPELVNPGTLGSFCAVFYSDGFSITDNDVNPGFLLKRPVKKPIRLNEECVLRMQELPAVETMATSVQVADPDLEFVPFAQIAQWIEQNGYRIAGPYREIGLEVPNATDFKGAIMELQMPVEPLRAPTNVSH